MSIEPGDRYGSLVVVECVSRSKNGTKKWKCTCDCGGEVVKFTTQLSGCMSDNNGLRCRDCFKASISRQRRTHGKTLSREYYSWKAMHSRCNNPKNPDYHLYGGRGVKVCERWGSFENFLADMGSRPTGKTLDRIDPHGNYEPGNCRWATHAEQANNKRKVR